ncbi:MAG TPA: YkgJ family cysteine cluster protein, partial [Deltaproteobacteria bacterium]|nr:YkgJ family cysteine cluster protein [Deltaproteobacteria bacterium]
GDARFLQRTGQLGYTLKVNRPEKITCQRCGTCCLADMIGYVTEEDIARWKRQGRDDIFHIIDNEQAFWAGDHFISARDGRVLKCCPFLAWDEHGSVCSIYETRPGVCRDYVPGSSQICPLWKRNRE